MTLVRMAIAAATLSAATAVVPSLAQQSGPPANQSPGVSAQQDAMSDAMVSKVGVALLHVSIIRRDYAQRERSADSPQRRQDLTVQVRQKIEKAVTDQGLSLQQYDQAMRMAQVDPTLKECLISAARSAAE
jgi:hypothetical protein